METKTKAQIGSISTGTMRPEDLIDTFEHELGWLGFDLEKLAGIKEECYQDKEEGEQFYLDELFDLLNEKAPAYCFFGAHPGDGTDFGFWVSWDSIEDALYCKELMKADELPDKPTIDELGYPMPCLQVSDHGNCELYVWNGKEWESEWSCV
jgi:hypothetical protein